MSPLKSSESMHFVKKSKIEAEPPTFYSIDWGSQEGKVLNGKKLKSDSEFVDKIATCTFQELAEESSKANLSLLPIRIKDDQNVNRVYGPSAYDWLNLSENPTDPISKRPVKSFSVYRWNEATQEALFLRKIKPKSDPRDKECVQLHIMACNAGNALSDDITQRLLHISDVMSFTKFLHKNKKNDVDKHKEALEWMDRASKTCSQLLKDISENEIKGIQDKSKVQFTIEQQLKDIALLFVNSNEEAKAMKISDQIETKSLRDTITQAIIQHTRQIIQLMVKNNKITEALAQLETIKDPSIYHNAIHTIFFEMSKSENLQKKIPEVMEKLKGSAELSNDITTLSFLLRTLGRFCYLNGDFSSFLKDLNNCYKRMEAVTDESLKILSLIHIHKALLTVDAYFLNKKEKHEFSGSLNDSFKEFLKLMEKNRENQLSLALIPILYDHLKSNANHEVVYSEAKELIPFLEKIPSDGTKVMYLLSLISIFLLDDKYFDLVLSLIFSAITSIEKMTPAEKEKNLQSLAKCVKEAALGLFQAGKIEKAFQLVNMNPLKMVKLKTYERMATTEKSKEMSLRLAKELFLLKKTLSSDELQELENTISNCLSQLALNLVSENELDNGVELALQIPDEDIKDETLYTIIDIFKEKLEKSSSKESSDSLMKKMIDTTNLLLDGEGKALEFSWLAETCILQGNNELGKQNAFKSFTLLSQLDSIGSQDIAINISHHLQQAGEQLLSSGNYIEAHSLASLIPLQYIKAETFLFFSKQLWNNKDYQRAVECNKTAIKIALEITSHKKQTDVLSDIFDFTLNRIEKCFKSPESTLEDDAKFITWFKEDQEKILEDLVNEAKTVARSIYEKEVKAGALAEVMNLLLKMNRKDEAMVFAKESREATPALDHKFMIQEYNTTIEPLFLKGIDGLIEQGNYKQAIELTGLLIDDDKKVIALKKIKLIYFKSK